MTYPFFAPITRLAVDRMPLMMEVDICDPPPQVLVTSSDHFMLIHTGNRQRVLTALRFVTPSAISLALARYLLEKAPPEPFSEDLLRKARLEAEARRSLGALRVLMPEDTPPKHPVRQDAELAPWLPPAMVMLADTSRSIGFFALHAGKGQYGVCLVMDPEAVRMCRL